MIPGHYRHRYAREGIYVRGWGRGSSEISVYVDIEEPKDRAALVGRICELLSLRGFKLSVRPFKEGACTQIDIEV